MMKILSGVALAFGLALVAPAMAVPGQCSMTGFGEFPCDVVVDGGGLTFALPDGRALVFAHSGDGQGQGYLIAADAERGQRPEELGMFVPVENELGCWNGAQDEITFCAATAQ
jgi:hypothetical protein